MMQLSPAGLAFVKARESFRDKAYLDSGGVPTVGYGATGPDVHLGMVVTDEWATARLQTDLGDAERCVNEKVRVPLSQGEFDALVDLTYNIGVGAFSHSVLLAKLNANDYAGADARFQKWDEAGGRVISGLEARRLAEAAMFSGRVA